MEFRASSLPFCQRAFWLDKKLEPASWRCYSEEVRFWRGHGVHNCLQFWLGQAGILFGDWECPTCQKTLGTPYVVHDAPGPPGDCPRHGVTLRYREYELSYKGLSGHPDGLILDRDDTAGTSFSLLEVKTLQHWASKNSSYPDWMTIKRPYGPHVEQANAYACMVPRLKGFKIVKVLIWYVSIDRPTWKPKIFEFDPDENRFQKHIDTLRKIESQSLDDLPPACDPKTRNPFCVFSEVGYCSMEPEDLQKLLRKQR